MSNETTEIKLPGTPKPWMNRAVMAMLKMPGLRSMLGKGLLILTVTGARTGKRYTTPVQYVRDDDRLIVLSQRHRTWWRNLRERPQVEIVMRGETTRAEASVAEGHEARDAIATTLRLNPRTAKFYHVAIGENGQPDPASVEKMHAAFVVIVIDVA